MQELMEAQKKFEEKKAEAEILIRRKKEASSQQLNYAAELQKMKEDELLQKRKEDELRREDELVRI